MQDVAVVIRKKQKPISLFVHRLAQEAHAGGLQALVRGVEIVHVDRQMADARFVELRRRKRASPPARSSCRRTGS
jgi:hypothetical protein